MTPPKPAWHYTAAVIPYWDSSCGKWRVMHARVSGFYLLLSMVERDEDGYARRWKFDTLGEAMNFAEGQP